jgi:hypothetical protein
MMGGTFTGSPVFSSDDRFEARELPTWRDDTTFHQFLASFGASLPLRQASGLLEVGLRKRVLSVTEGITVRICRLLDVKWGLSRKWTKCGAPHFVQIPSAIKSGVEAGGAGKA